MCSQFASSSLTYTFINYASFTYIYSFLEKVRSKSHLICKETLAVNVNLHCVS